MFYNYLIFSMVALSLCILKKHFVSYFENVWLAGNFLKGSLDGINVNFTGIR